MRVVIAISNRSHRQANSSFLATKSKGQRGVLATLIGVMNYIDNAALSHGDRKSTRLNSSHVAISYAVFCLKKKNQQRRRCGTRGEQHGTSLHRDIAKG